MSNYSISQICEVISSLRLVPGARHKGDRFDKRLAKHRTCGGAATVRERCVKGEWMRYFITFACYGGHLHGDESGSVDRRHNVFGSRSLETDPQRVAAE